MQTLHHPDKFRLSAAVGWIELGNYGEANEELENITASSRSHPDVLEVRWEIYAKAENWDACLDIARAILAQDPERMSAWIHHAYALRRLPSGGVQAAFEALLPAADKFGFQSIAPFNLACYAAQLGRIPEAESWLAIAFKRAEGNFEGKEMKLMALNEPDLEPLWVVVGKDKFFP